VSFRISVRTPSRPRRTSSRGRWRTGAAALALLLLQPIGSRTLNATAPHGSRVPGDVIVIVNAGNPIRELQRDQVAAYFLRRRATWPSGARVDPVDLPPDSPARSAFSRDVLRRSPGAVSAYWVQEIFAGRSEPPEVKSSEASVVSYVAATPGAIGYVTTMPSGGAVHALVILP
jgi:hypothetical protein